MTTVSIVTGTYNRLASLKRMIESVRRALPRGIAYNFIICDGGSTDGTLEYLSTLPDVHILAHGELKGAIKAFTEAANLSVADYTVLANDDIEFKPNSLLAALRHLETRPTCGAVAFADNRTSIVTGDGKEYRVEGMGATLHTGEKVMVPYAQVGMFRTELGRMAGWWGANDAVMSQARTYLLSYGRWAILLTR
jgi:glycosyltransferase involved in cell wall biosynthesis